MENETKETHLNLLDGGPDLVPELLVRGHLPVHRQLVRVLADRAEESVDLRREPDHPTLPGGATDGRERKGADKG